MIPTIVITPDRLGAILRLPAEREVPRELLRVLVAGAGIRFGLLAEALHEALHADNEDRDLIIAIGHAAEPGAPESLDPPFDPAHPRDLAAGEELGRIVAGHLGTPGMGVDGAVIPAPGLATLALGDGLERSGDRVRATRPGRVTRLPDGRLAIPSAGAATVRERTDIVVQLDIHQLEAFIVLDAGVYVPAAVLRGACERVGITTGSDEAAILAATAPANEQRRLVIARGRTMAPGEPARIEFLVEVVTLTADLDGGGRIDPHERGHWTEVDPGTPLARVIPATRGTAGITVKGQPIPEKPGRDIDINSVRGEGTEVARNDACLLVAAIAGIVRRNDRGNTSVVPKLGDPPRPRPALRQHRYALPRPHRRRREDRLPGEERRRHLDRRLDRGRRISAAGDLVVKGGILPGRERVKARGDITVRHAEGRTLKARNLEVTGDCRMCTVLATGGIKAKVIAGGSLTCTGSLEVGDLGDLGEVKTTVLVGVNPFLATVYRGAMERLDAAQAEADHLRERVQLLTHRIKQRAAGHFDVHGDQHTLRQTMHDYEAAVALLRDCKCAIEAHAQEIEHAKAAPSLARVVVTGTAWPGVEIGIGETATYRVQERLTRPVFVLKDGRIILLG